jgi:hypothetical protein
MVQFLFCCVLLRLSLDLIPLLLLLSSASAIFPDREYPSQSMDNEREETMSLFDKDAALGDFPQISVESFLENLEIDLELKAREFRAGALQGRAKLSVIDSIVVQTWQCDGRGLQTCRMIWTYIYASLFSHSPEHSREQWD